jgi:hypothetical protein
MKFQIVGLTIISVVLLALCAIWFSGRLTQDPSIAEIHMAKDIGRRILLDHAIVEYQWTLNEKPSIENRLLVKAVLGDNRLGKVFISRSDLNLNESGEVVDRYGKPLVIQDVAGQVSIDLTKVGDK